MHHENLRGDALCRCGHRTAERGQMQMLNDPGGPAGILDDFGLLLAAHPMRHFHRLQGDFESGRAQRRGDLLDRSIGLRASRSSAGRSCRIGRRGVDRPIHRLSPASRIRRKSLVTKPRRAPPAADAAELNKSEQIRAVGKSDECLGASARV